MSKKTKWQVAEDFGVDTTLLKASIEKSPTQRVRDHINALELAEKLREAGRKYYAGIRTSS